MPDFTAIAIVFTVVGFPMVCTVATIGLLLTWNLRRRELAVRELEAKAMIQSSSALPEWLDPRDAEAVAEWKLARRELDRVAARAALGRG